MRFARVRVGGVPRFCHVDGEQLYLLGEGEPERAERTGERVAIGDVEFLAPVEPTKILAVLGAFRFGREPEVARQTSPKFTSKLITSVNAHGCSIIKPFDMPNTLDGEAELGVVLGRDVRRVSPEGARDAILGFTCVNDMTLTDQGVEDMDFMRAKSVDTFASFGPWIDTDVSPDQVRKGLVISGSVNGVPSQLGNTADYTWDVLETISWASQLFTLRRFDLIALGTPVPVSRVDVGDVMTVTVEGVGTLINKIAREELIAS
ncbi:fumarylacetoacetate hydrolase family protein [Parafrankia sp. BMG5.11]|nr:fumarylacetoacetate hydrolase family protein [Parafrankia sp. BMG5.11]TCJ33666.1 FAA hydrolase family protein [Parafrankia sp. BMG5.11]